MVLRKLVVMLRKLIWPGFVVLLLMGQAGCRVGESGLLTQANPTTRVKFKPATGDVEYFDNSGDTFSAKKFKAMVDGASIEADELEIGDRSVENREANVGQMVQANAMIGTITTGLVDAFKIGVTLADVLHTPKEAQIAEAEAPSWITLLLGALGSAGAGIGGYTLLKKPSTTPPAPVK